MTRAARTAALLLLAAVTWLLFAVAVADARPDNPSAALVAMAAAWICRPAVAAIARARHQSEPQPKE